MAKKQPGTNKAKDTDEYKKIVQYIRSTQGVFPRKQDELTYYLDRDMKNLLTKKEYEIYCTWMRGQTGIMVYDPTVNKMVGASYAWDIERFYRHLNGEKVLLD